MRCYVYAKESGKFIRVVDRIGGTEAFNDFVDAENTLPIDVRSNDGQSGSVDTYKRLSAQNVWEGQDTDYAVRAEEVLEFRDP